MRVALAPAADARQQPAVRERRQHRHAQRVRRARRCRCRCLHALVQLQQCCSRAPQQCFAGGVQHDAATLALEQPEAELRFETPDLLADRAVRDVQDRGGGAQVLQLGDCPKCGQRMQGEPRHAGKYN